MNYEKKYKDALERAREELGSRCFDRGTIEYIFPELAESDDERIRKDLITYIKSIKGSSLDLTIRSIDWLSWLEKQGEQKPVGWSEEDEKILNVVINDIQERHPESMWKINCGSTAAVSTQYIIDWLKSLKPQSHWKPTEEQMNLLIGLSYNPCLYSYERRSLEELYNDLKKL